MADTQTASVAQVIAARFSTLPQVQAVALAGSRTTGATDAASDFDIYVYTQVEIPPEVRAEIAAPAGRHIEIDNQFWEPGDEWIDAASGLGVDIMYRAPDWIEAQLERVLVKHHASVGYSTCLWHNVLVSQPLYDRDGWFERLQSLADQPYPEPLRQAIVAKNYPILSRNISAYTHQIEKALARQDAVSVNHRLAALLASYFDILFAVNRQPHPGEKRLVAAARQLCSRLPAGFERDIEAVLRAACPGDASLPGHLARLIEGLDRLLAEEKVRV